MKQNSHRPSESSSSRVPLVVVESARRAGATATRVARRGRRFVGRTMDRTERYAKSRPWTGLSIAACAGACIGTIATILWFKT